MPILKLLLRELGDGLCALGAALGCVAREQEVANGR